MPWGHAAFAYVLYSLGHRVTTRNPPSGLTAIVALFGSQLPDLVDKPLSWGLHLFPQGYSVAHSVFVAVPVGLFVLAVAARKRRLGVGAAFAVGYWSHLVGDVLVAMAERHPFPFDRVLWPLVTLPPYGHPVSLFGRVHHVIETFFYSLTAGQQLTFLAIYFTPFFFAFLLWLVDGAPIVADLGRAVRRSG